MFMLDNKEKIIIPGWKYYNHAIIPMCEPHEIPDLEAIRDGKVWKMENKPLLIRWTEDWDCGHETRFWYCIKDNGFDISSLKSKRRYEIKKGIKNFDVRIINPEKYKEDLFNVAEAAFSVYPEKYRPKLVKDKFFEEISTWNGTDVFGAFSTQDGKLCGYAQLVRGIRAINFNIQKTIPACEGDAINAAIVMAIVDYYMPDIEKGYYIVDGARPASHETHFQDYLEKYFGFRKAYCTLCVKYKWWVGTVVKMLYPFRNSIERMEIPVAHNISAVLRMEEWSRN